MANKQRRQRCAATARDGQRCGRMCAMGEVLCSKHDPTRPPTGIVAEQDTDDVRVLLRRLTKSRDETIKLRAIEAILKREERSCPVCETRKPQQDYHNRVIARLTPDQRMTLRDHLEAIETIKTTAARQPIYEAPIDELHEHPEPTGPASDVAIAPDLGAATEEVDDPMPEGYEDL